jgi:carbonic anhydrase
LLLLQVTRKNNSYLDPLIAAIDKVRDPESNTTLFGSFVMLDQLLPNDMEHFFKYQGSLTTPPCSESVTWIVFREISGISIEQMSYFRSLMMHSEDHERIVIGHNIRDLQKVRKREILASGMGSHAVTVLPPLELLPFLLVTTAYFRHNMVAV